MNTTSPPTLYAMRPSSGATAIAPPVVVADKRYFGAGYVSVGGNVTLYTSYGYFTSDGTFHAYIPDSRGNIAAVVNGSTGAVEQQTAYYPYGATTSQSTGADVNPMKFGGKELATLFGRHEYDYSARMYAPLSARFSSPDRKAWDYPWLSPYTFCAADPINNIDPTGEDWIMANFGDDIFFFYHPDIKSAKDINKHFENDSKISYMGESGGAIFKNTQLGITREVTLNADGSFTVEGWDGAQNQEYDSYGLHVGNHMATDLSTMNGNSYGSYLGSDNPKSADGKKDSYAVPPADYLDYAAFLHDKEYDLIGTSGPSGLIGDVRALGADERFLSRVKKVGDNPISEKQAKWVGRSKVGFSIIVPYKRDRSVKTPHGVSLHLRK